jgi:hypothetical protein
MTTLPSWAIGLARGLGTALLTAGVAYLANPANLTFLSASTAVIVSGIALMAEHIIEQQTGKALFGAVRTRAQ